MNWDEFKALSVEEQAEACAYTCDKPKYQSYYSTFSGAVSLGDEFPYGYFCTNCKKPYFSSLENYKDKPDVYKNLSLNTFIDRRRVKV